MLRNILTLVFLLGSFSSVVAEDGFVGIYADAQGTIPCASVPQMSGTTLFLVAKLQGGSEDGITAAEFRVEVSNPSGWYFTFNPPTGTTVLGSLLDTDPMNPTDGGAIIAFATCQQGSGNVSLGTMSVFNASGSPTTLAVKRHGSPPNQNYSCPLFVICDGPVYSKICMTSGSQPGCDLGKVIALNTTDPAVFTTGLNSIGGGEGGEPDPPLPMPPDLFATVPMLLANPIKPDIVGIDGQGSGVQAKTLADTTWLANWSFDGPASTCAQSDWTVRDNLIENDGPNYWNPVSTQYGGQGYIQNKAAVLRHDGCWTRPGYGNKWDYSIKLKYKGTGSKLSFDYLLGSEDVVTGDSDYLRVEADSAGNSNSRVQYEVYGPNRRPATFRDLLFSATGKVLDGRVQLLNLPAFGAPNVEHSVLIRFVSGPSGSDEDGVFDSPIDAGLVVDNISISGGQLNYSEDWEGVGFNPNMALINSGRSLPFGVWARLYSHVTDNEVCADNTTCSWLFTDPAAGYTFSDMGFGPGMAVIRGWSDQEIVSPWIAMNSSQPRGAVLSFREFPGNRFAQGRIARSWSIRGRYNSGTCVTAWSAQEDVLGKGTWEMLDNFEWVTRVYDVSRFMQPAWEQVQVKFRVADWSAVFGFSQPATINRGPGPYIDRVRFGRFVKGVDITPGEDTRTQAQDAFPTNRNSILPGEHYYPTEDRFGTSAFSMGFDIGAPRSEYLPGSTNLITGDSVTIQVRDLTGGGVRRIGFCYRVVAGPHVGKIIESTSTMLANGLAISDSVFTEALQGSRTFFMDFDDTYFRGGDVLQYFWFAQNAAGNYFSYPEGIHVQPENLVGIEAAEQLTGGLLEVNFLPTINWSQAYLDRIADPSDPIGDLDPTTPELANSSQANCMLYVNKVNTARRSGPANRTSFMYTLDRLGYKGRYDVYDVQGWGNTNNDLGSRAIVTQCQGYALIVHDVGRMSDATIPDGSEDFNLKIDQAIWYQNYLDNGEMSAAGKANLWVIGENWAFENASNALVSTRMGIVGPAADQAFLNPIVEGQTSFTFVGGTTQGFSTDRFSLQSGCPIVRGFDGLSAGGNSTVAFKYKSGTTLGFGAVVLKSDNANNSNTVGMAFNWFDIYEPGCSVPPCSSPIGVRTQLAKKILDGIGIPSCYDSLDTTDLPPSVVESAPLVTALHQNVPNPFNPTTEIRFDLAMRGYVVLQIFDIAGRLVRTLSAEEKPAMRYSIPWDAKDDASNPVASGVYLYRLQAGDFIASRKLVVMK